MFAKFHARRSLDFFSRPTSTPCTPSLKSHRINIFADPHPLTPAASIFYKNMVGEVARFSSPTSNLQSLTSLFATHPKYPPITPLPATDPVLRNSKSFACHTCEIPPGVAGKLLTRNARGTANLAWALPQSMGTTHAHTRCRSALLFLGVHSNETCPLQSRPHNSIGPVPGTDRGLKPQMVFTSHQSPITSH